MESQVSVDDGSSWAGRIFASKLVDYLAILGASGSLLAGFSSLWKDRAEYKALAEDCSEKADSAKMAETLIRGRLAGCFRGEPVVNFDPEMDSALWSSTFAGYPRYTDSLPADDALALERRCLAEVVEDSTSNFRQILGELICTDDGSLAWKPLRVQNPRRAD